MWVMRATHADRPGVAHFCEHMLFLGNKQYPREGAFAEYVQRRGGSSNAYTAAEDTCYHFDVDATDFEGALDRFSAFFEAPTFSPSGVERELEAIESEDSKNKLSDGFRLLQLDRSVRGEKTYKKFGTGNRATLLQSDEATPARYAALRRVLVDFHETYYTADRMALVVLAREPLDTLQRLAEDKFGRLPRGTGPRNPAVAPTALVPPTNGLRPALLVAPVGAARRLALSWRVPYAGDVDAARRAEIRAKAGSIIASVLGDEGAGSLLSWARGEGYASGISASASPDGSTGLRLDLAYELTSKGLNFWPDLVAATVGAVARLREKRRPAVPRRGARPARGALVALLRTGESRRPRAGPRHERPGGRLGRRCLMIKAASCLSFGGAAPEPARRSTRSSTRHGHYWKRASSSRTCA